MKSRIRDSYGRRLVAAIATAAVVVLVAGCGSSGSSKDSGTEKTTSLKIGISPISVYAAGYEMSGCLKDKGYSLSLQEFSATPDRLAALVNGSIDMAFGGFTDTIKLDSQGGSIVAVSNAATGGYQLVASTKSNVNSIADLKGKKIAVPTGTIQEIALRYSLEKAGLNPESDTQFLQMDYSQMPIALKRGDIDAFVGTAPYPSISIAQGEKEIPWPDLPWGRLNSGLVTTKDFASGQSSAVHAVVNCLNQSTNKLNSNKDKLRRLFVSKYNVPEKAVDLLMKDVSLTTHVDPQQVQGLIDTEFRLGYIKQKPTLSQVLQVVS